LTKEKDINHLSTQQWHRFLRTTYRTAHLSRMTISLWKRDRTQGSVWQMSYSTLTVMKIRSVLCWLRSKNDSTRWKRSFQTSSNPRRDMTSPKSRRSSKISSRNSTSRKKSSKNQAFQVSSHEHSICSKIKSRILRLKISRNCLL